MLTRSSKLEMSWKFLGNFSGNVPGEFLEMPQKFPGSFPEKSWKIKGFPGQFPEVSRKFPRNIPEIYRRFAMGGPSLCLNVLPSAVLSACLFSALCSVCWAFAENCRLPVERGLQAAFTRVAVGSSFQGKKQG